MIRRRFLTAAGLGTTALALRAAQRADAGAPTTAAHVFIDTNVSLGAWAVRSTWADTPARLVAKLQSHGVTSAWAGTFEAVLHTDLAGANARLAAACAGTDGFLQAFGAVNPTLPDWEDDVRRCDEAHGMRGIRVYPNYHGYALDDPRFARLLAVAAQRKLLVQVSLALEDDRSQNPVLVAPPVNAAPLADLLPKNPGLRLMLLNSGYRVLSGNVALLRRLADAGVWFELAMLEGVAGLETLLRNAPNIRIAFGSHAPYFYFEAALLKLRESVLSPAQLDAIRGGHATAALSP
jgi:uncharacterized protein